MQDMEIKKLTIQESEKLEGLLTYKEFSDVLHKMKPDKSLGITLFTAKILKVFLDAVRSFCIKVN